MSLLWIIGLLILVAVFWDVFITIFTLRGGGPFTERISKWMWHCLLMVHGRRRIHKLLSLAGPMMLLITVFWWYLGLSIGWFLIFLSKSSSAVTSNTQESTTVLDKVYFLGTTLSDLGYGDIVPLEFPWTLWSSIAATSATLLLSAALSYILPVVSAGVQKRVLAKRIHHLGDTAEEVIGNVWQDGGDSMSGYVVDTIVEIQEFTHKHLSYPILVYFHSAKAEQSLGLAVLKLSDALFLMNKGVDGPARPPRGFEIVARNTLQEFSHLAHKIKARADSDCGNTPPHLSLATVRKAGFSTTSEQQFEAALRDYMPLRDRLCEFCAKDGWPVD